MARRERSGPRIIEVELNLFSLAVAGTILIGLLAVAFFLGRASAGGPARAAIDAAAPERARPGPDTASGVEELDGGTLFDDEGAGGGKRAPEYQVTREGSRAGRFTLEIGRTSNRASAESLRQAAVSAGVVASIVGDGEGGFLVTGGPFRSRAEAEGAGQRLGRLFGRAVQVRESESRP